MRIHELRNAWRRLRARPGYATVSVAILGLGLGTMLFLLTLVNGVILSPLPFPEGDRLVGIGQMRDGNIGIGELASEDYGLLARELKSYDAIATYASTTVNLGRGDGAQRYRGALLSHEVLPMLGVQPALGRAFDAADDAPGAAAVVLLGHDTWRNDFDGDPKVIGTTVRVNGRDTTVIGVMPEMFAFPYRQQVWLPRRLVAGDRIDGTLFARLKPGVNVVQAASELAAVEQALGAELKARREDRTLVVKSWALRGVTESSRRVVWMTFSTGVLVLLLACANVANLQLSQTLSRRRELAVRSALGAGRGQLLRELLAESLVLSLVATAIALALAHAGGLWMHAIFSEPPSAPPYYVDFGVDLRMVGLAGVAALLTTLLAGLVPAWRASQADVQDALRDGDKGSSGGGFARFSKGLVVAEIALTVILLVGAGMFIRGAREVLDFDFGTSADPKRVATGQVALAAEQYPDGAAQTAFFERVVERLRADPQVEAASAATTVPGATPGGVLPVGAEGEPKPANGYRRATIGHADDTFADTYGVRLLAGRWFDGRDTASSTRVAVVDQRFVEAVWPGVDPLGRRITTNPDGGDAQSLTVIGVVAPLHLTNAEESRDPTLVMSLRQQPRNVVTLAVRTRGAAADFAPRLAAIVRGEDADTPVYSVRTQEQAIEMSRLGDAVLTRIFSAVGLLALVMAAAGLYSVLAFSVTQRTREIGIRRAMGAGRRKIAATVGRRVLWQFALGIALGVAIGLPWSKVLAGPWEHLRSYDPAVFGLVVAVIALACLVAALAPLRRAMRVDPIIALRHE